MKKNKPIVSVKLYYGFLHKKNDRNKMENTSTIDEKMPNKMKELFMFGIEHLLNT